MPKTSTNRGAKEYLKLIGPGTIITVLGFIIAFQFVAPAPPRHITIATGSANGAYYKFGKAYSAILKKYGITLEVIRTAGSAENLQLLRGPRRQRNKSAGDTTPGPQWCLQPKYLFK